MWYDIQANPERISTVGNAELVVPGAVEVEGGADVAFGRQISMLTPVRVKFGVYRNLQISLNTEGFLVRPDLQRPAGVGFGFKVPLYADLERPWPAVAARLDTWSPIPSPVDNLARAQAEIVASRTWDRFSLAASAGGDFAADGASAPMGGLAVGLAHLGPFGLHVEGRYRAGLLYGGGGVAWRLGRDAALDLGGGYRADGAIVLRTGFTRSFPLPW